MSENVIYSINGPVVKVKNAKDFSMLEMVYVGHAKLMGEVISISKDLTTIQVYETTTGLKPGEPVISTGSPICATLGPGILRNIFDGMERPLKAIAEQSGAFIEAGSDVDSLDVEKLWDVTMKVKVGDVLKGGDIYATCPETDLIEHRCMLSPLLSGKVVEVKENGQYKINDVVMKIEDEHGQIHECTLCQKWPIKQARPTLERLPISIPLVTGQRVIDTLFPIAKGGTAGMAASKLLILEGISGTGKTSLPYSFSRYLYNPATIVSVQPSYRDRSELLGYFNEFSKRFNETEFLRALYEANYREEPTLIVLDEMNLARIEYYFAEMLSVLEMPSKDEWVLDLVPTAWEGDPVKMDGGKIHVSDATWFVGTANNDDSTFTITDKVYDRAMPIELNERADAFECDPQPACYVTTEHLEYLFQKAKVEHPISDDLMDKMQKLDSYLVTRFKLSFGNRIMKQMYDFIPVYVACGGTELGGMDYIVARKVLKKFESMNVTFVRDEITGLITYIDKLFGKAEMQDSKAYLRRIQNLY